MSTTTNLSQYEISRRRTFHRHALFYGIINVGIFLIWMVSGGLSDPTSGPWPLPIVWAIILAIHAVNVYFPKEDPMTPEDREEYLDLQG